MLEEDIFEGVFFLGRGRRQSTEENQREIKRKQREEREHPQVRLLDHILIAIDILWFAVTM